MKKRTDSDSIFRCRARALLRALLLAAAGTNANAAFINVDFMGAAGGLGTFSGTFSGETGIDDILGLTEVVDFSIAFSGPTTGNVLTTVSGAGQLTRFAFDAGTSSFLEGPDVYESAGDTTQPYFFAPGPPLPGALGVGTYVFFTDGSQGFDEGNAVTSLDVTVTLSNPVPAPATLGLVGAGLAVFGILNRRNRRRPMALPLRRGMPLESK